MKHNTCLPWMVVICGLLLSLQGCRSQPADIVTLSELLMPPGCESACWQGIEPEKTTVDELVQTLEENNIEYARNDIGFKTEEFVWNIEENDLLWPETRKASYDMHAYVTDYPEVDEIKVLQVGFAAVSLCVSTIVDVFGVPDEIEESADLSLLYYEKGLVFYSDKQLDRVKSFQMRSGENLRLSFTNPSEIDASDFQEMISQDCVDQFSD